MSYGSGVGVEVEVEGESGSLVMCILMEGMVEVVWRVGE